MALPLFVPALVFVVLVLVLATVTVLALALLVVRALVRVVLMLLVLALGVTFFVPAPGPPLPTGRLGIAMAVAGGEVVCDDNDDDGVPGLVLLAVGLRNTRAAAFGGGAGGRLEALGDELTGFLAMTLFVLLMVFMLLASSSSRCSLVSEGGGGGAGGRSGRSLGSGRRAAKSRSGRLRGTEGNAFEKRERPVIVVDGAWRDEPEPAALCR